MQELTAQATLVEYPSLGGGGVTAMLERTEVEAMLSGGTPSLLWFELGFDGEDESSRLTVELTDADLDELLRRSEGHQIVLALDEDELAGLLREPEVEAHGMRGALAIAVVTAAIAAPAGLAAVPQTASPAATAQVSSLAAKMQVANAQVAKRQIASAQVTKGAAKAQISKSLVVKASGITTLRGGLAR